MGNINVTPTQYANKSYTDFLKKFVTDELTLKEKNRDGKIDYEFSIFLEDSLVNDKSVRKFNLEEKEMFAGALCFLQSTVGSKLFSVADMTESVSVATSRFAKNLKFADNVVDSFGKSLSAGDVLSKYVTSKYCWDGLTFYTCIDDKWVPCKENQIDCMDYLECIGADLRIKTFDNNNEIVTKGTATITDYWNSFVKTAVTFRQTEYYSSSVTEIVSNNRKFNQSPKIIYCRSGAVKINKGYQRNYKLSHFASVTLDFDPIKETTPLVDKYINRLHCDNKGLATFLITCGASVIPTLTIVSGPSRSGKSTLLKVVRSIYGPYACTQDDHLTSKVNYDLVRTCFMDCSRFPSEEELKSHPCSHLVITCEACNIEGTFAGRKINTFSLTDSLSEDEIKEDICVNLSTRKQRGSLLGRALQDYDTSIFVGNKDSTSELLNFILSEIKETNATSTDDNNKSSVNNKSSSSSSSSASSSHDID